MKWLIRQWEKLLDPEHRGRFLMVLALVGGFASIAAFFWKLPAGNTLTGSSESSFRVNTSNSVPTNTNNVTFSNDVSITVENNGQKVNQANLNDLVAVLKSRATKVIAFLNEEYPSGTQKFKELHEKHIGHLTLGNVIAAHDVLLEIHEFSFHINELIRSRKVPAYCKSRTEYIYVRGSVISGYVSNEFFSVSAGYPPPIHKKSNGQKGSALHSGTCASPSIVYEMAPPLPAEEIYLLIRESSDAPSFIKK